MRCCSCRCYGGAWAAAAFFSVARHILPMPCPFLPTLRRANCRTSDSTPSARARRIDPDGQDLLRQEAFLRRCIERFRLRIAELEADGEVQAGAGSHEAADVQDRLRAMRAMAPSDMERDYRIALTGEEEFISRSHAGPLRVVKWQSLEPQAGRKYKRKSPRSGNNWMIAKERFYFPECRDRGERRPMGDPSPAATGEFQGKPAAGR